MNCKRILGVIAIIIGAAIMIAVLAGCAAPQTETYCVMPYERNAGMVTVPACKAWVIGDFRKTR